MAARWVAITMLLAMLGVIGMFLWPIFRPPEPVASATWQTPGPPASGEKRVTGRAGTWTLYAWAVPGAEGAVTVTVAARDLEERPVASLVPPTAVLLMLDMAMAKERIVLAQEGSGFWRGAGQLSMAGRWNLQVELNGETVNVPFEIVLRQR